MKPSQEVLTKLEQQGACVWLTGLSGAGKTTIANALSARLVQRGRSVTTLDGDLLRQNQSKDLSFSRQDRIVNILRAGQMAVEAVEKGDVAIVALVSPYEEARETVRSLFVSTQFLLVHVSTPLVECEARDVKGLYKKAREGLIDNFTGVSDVYEQPLNPDIIIDASQTQLSDAVTQIASQLS